MVKHHAKEISTLKAKMTEQGAKILLNKDDSFNPTSSYPTMNKSGVLKKAGISNRLQPLRAPKSSYSNLESLGNDPTSYTPHKSSTIKRDYGDKVVGMSSYTDHKPHSKYPNYKGKSSYGSSVLNREYNSDYTKY
mmetsp:Transcript_10117/g.8912  ORF Transcript_10117/g.8912 Transcript_10117/m.8912 type:complete len:135 (+) Transcript_10117:301-705(+)